MHIKSYCIKKGKLIFLKLNGFRCIIMKNWMGVHCGYVMVNIPTYKANEIECHGDITFNEPGIIGFDCAHSGDINPYFDQFIGIIGRNPTVSEFSTYKDQSFVKKELLSITEQLLELGYKSINY